MLDGRPLVEIVNTKLKVPVVFKFPKQHEVDPETTFYDLGDALHPDMLSMDSDALELSREELLASMVAYVFGEKILVRDIIDYEALVRGGVSFGDPRNRAQQALLDASTRINMKGSTLSLYHLRHIGCLVLQAVTPLRDVVEENTDPEDYVDTETVDERRRRARRERRRKSFSSSPSSHARERGKGFEPSHYLGNICRFVLATRRNSRTS